MTRAKEFSSRLPSEKIQKKKGRKTTKKTSKKKINDSTAVDDPTQLNDESDDGEKDKDEDSAGPVDLSRYRYFLRELDLNVFALMKQDLVMTPQPERGADTSPDFGPAELRFLLEDYVAKLEHSFPSGGVNWFTQAKSSTVGVGDFAIWDLLPLQEKAVNAVSMLSILCEKLEQIGESCRNLLDINDGMWDGPGMFVEGTANVKICFALLLRAMNATFAWNGFQNPQNLELLSSKFIYYIF